ncbi:SDR family oxidoreductase [Dongia soli]|uniref:SDR family oxidoreductase n=1 Tax=Dongia soli TaxID=600628 RepID=A0ABU5EA69_9PROT|nr:SDR family oxidoreductase [Dongia soli]MDY0883242.1 SDR family oxidoreductase [Dongia soli]
MRTILLTGGSGKIGRKLIEGFLENGDRVIFTTRSRNSADEVLRHFEPLKAGDRLHPIGVDLCVPDAASKLVQSLGDKAAEIHGVINNARDQANLALKGRDTPTQDQWLNEFNLAVVAAHDLGWRLANLPNGKLRRIVNISSIYGIVATNEALYEKEEQRAPIHYGVAKAALLHLTKEMAVRLAKRQIAVNAVSYGGVEGRVDAGFQARYGVLCPTGRMLRDDEVMGSVLFLMSESAESITGQNIVVDGGWSVW